MSERASNAVFLSYASQDAEVASRICDALRAAGIEVWFDQSELRGGDIWDRKIKQQIRECALFLPLISANTNARAEGYFRLEWKLAVDRSHLMADDAAFLMPAIISDIPDAAARVPDRFREVQWMRVLTAEAPTAYAARVRALLTGAPELPRVESRERTPSASAGGATARAAAAVPRLPSDEWRPGIGQVVPGTPWTLEQKLGEGGFGEVWLGRHKTMKELRVFKFCFELERVRSLKREMTLFRVLKEHVGAHPNIVRLLDVHFNESPYYVEMDYVEGQSLKIWCEQQGGVEKVPLATRLEIVAQIADALHAAHASGVIHRDVKPGNILLAQSAVAGAQLTAKLSDFGIGQVMSDEALDGVTKSGFTKSMVAGSSAVNSGTQMYMAPELVAGQAASVGSDIYSLGVVLFQLAAGDLRRPLTTDWPRAIADPVLREDLTRCFAGRAEERFNDAGELAKSLRAIESRRAAFQAKAAAEAARQRAAKRWRLALAAGVVAVVIGLGASLVWFLQRNAKLRWARQQALPEINRLVKAYDFAAAFALAVEAEKVVPDDPALTSLWPQISQVISVETQPAGADVYFKPYGKPGAGWQLLGTAPLKEVRVAKEYARWRITKPGFAEIERAGLLSDKQQFSLEPAEKVPAGMVRVEVAPREGARINLGKFFIDRHEVTNRQYKEFVNRGGYTKSEYWKQPFKHEARDLTWTQAMAEFRDATGQPGPATWKNGSYAGGEDDFPVTGVSWFEAAAYAEFMGKRLPSFHHWRAAAGIASVGAQATNITPVSNYSGRGVARVGSYQGITRWGAYDMAGNAKEWCWNEAVQGKRFILGGWSGEPVYMFTHQDAQSPFDRSPSNGFRCLQLEPGVEFEKAIDEPVVPTYRDYAKEQPVSDEVFKIYQSLFDYDKTSLDARTESADDSSALWRKEKVTFNAAYGNERVIAYVYLPKKNSPPYQVVIFCPGAGAPFSQRSSEKLGGEDRFEFVVEGGRAMVFPIYKGIFERGDGTRTAQSYSASKNDWRDLVVHWSKDLGRTLDYLETRKDIRSDKVGYFGFSLGAVMGSTLTAVEDRIKTNIFVAGGMSLYDVLPQVAQINFAPKIKIPTLMINGRYDFTFIEPSQRRLFDLLGSPPENKRYILLEKGHVLRGAEVAKDATEWLDRFLGPVK